ncbi:MAG: hypothetical protein RBT15_04635 [Gudongella sp.]|nr:hypothetical protein [Gudongella sp.]
MIESERAYRDWLIDQVNIIEEDYTHLLRELYSIEFYSLVKYDEDRGMDGLALRDEWAEGVGFKGSLDFGNVRVLEVLIGIARRIEFQLFGTRYYDEWDEVAIFWDMIENLGLDSMFGDISRYVFDEIRENVTHFLNREYFRHKKGNIFKFHNEPKDLRKLNIWTQMGLYIREKWPI